MSHNISGMNAAFVLQPKNPLPERLGPKPKPDVHHSVNTYSLTTLVENLENPPSGQNFVESPRTKSPRSKSLTGPLEIHDMCTDPSVLPYQFLMQDLDIRSPNSNIVGSPIAENTDFFRSPDQKRLSQTIPATATTAMSLTCPAYHLSTKRSPEMSFQNDEFLLGTPTQFNANVHQSSTTYPQPRSSTPFVHHERSPFTTFRPTVRNRQYPVIVAAIDGNHTTPPRTHEEHISCHNVGTYSLTPRIMPVNLVAQTGSGSKPYDPSTRGNSMKSSPIIKSLDRAADNQSKVEDPELKNYRFTKPIIFDPPTSGFELSTKRRTNHEKSQPPLPSIKLTPRTRKREFGQRVAEAESVSEDVETFPSRIKLFPKNERKVSVDETLSKESTLLDPDDAPIPILSIPTSNIPLVLQFNGDDMEETACAQAVRHFPPTLSSYQKKSRSLFDPLSSFDPIHRLILADAMAEAARKNEPLTDDEDSDVECNPDYVLCCPPSPGKRGENTVQSSGMTNVSSYDKNVQSAVSTGKSLGTTHFLPEAALQQGKSLSSAHRILGDNSQRGSTEEELCTTKTLNPKLLSAEIDLLEADRSNANTCSLARSADSAEIELNRDMFTPPPNLEEGNDFRTLSPPLLCPKIEGV
ncbi:hypothetical protein HJC23_009096 [Cyclotella cryptica]|uniref:Uncharacterized protein n=1 Tax=Cyclotella cryptica TaxID=29204 RepID=A0ABD3QYE2_9STRA|eukprot:CCRYP_000710-RA/>CCRYP_000710-RA protein AED:0.10 eAED:0.10 QI:0/-1/0/1/-1/1/1/0/635